MLALGNLDPRIHFAILSDFVDAPAREMPEDEAILEAARAGVEALNARLGEGRADRFYLFHRVRQWNPSENVVDGMGAQARQARGVEPPSCAGPRTPSFSVEVGDVAVFPSVRYCLTLDSDTRLPRDAAKKLVGILAHPLNRPRFDTRLGRVTEGYGILQPRVSVTMASAAGSLFARLYAGHTGVDPYTTAVSDTYQDLFGEGIFTGKGLYDVDAFIAALEGRVPENALLSHDLFEGLYARTALVTDVEVVDDYPASVLVHARRQHRWVRGDWQILRWLFPWVPEPLRPHPQPPAPHLALEDLRQPEAQPRGPGDRRPPPARAGRSLPGSPAVWTAAILAALAFPLYPLAPGGGSRARGRSSRGACSCGLRGKTARPPSPRSSLQLTFLASHAYERMHAIGLTLVRLGATQRRLLEWETAAASAARGAGLARRSGAELFVVEMIASPVIALAGPSHGRGRCDRPPARPPAHPGLVGGRTARSPTR